MGCWNIRDIPGRSKGLDVSGLRRDLKACELNLKPKAIPFCGGWGEGCALFRGAHR